MFDTAMPYTPKFSEQDKFETKKVSSIVHSMSRINLAVGISYNADPREVRKACLKAVDCTPNVLADPAPAVILSEFGDSALQFHVRCWTKVEHYWDSRGILTEEIKACLDEAGISIPYNQLDVHVIQS